MSHKLKQHLLMKILFHFFHFSMTNVYIENLTVFHCGIKSVGYTDRFCAFKRQRGNAAASF